MTRAVLPSLLLAVFFGGCGNTLKPPTGKQRELLAARSQAALNDFKTRDKSLVNLLPTAHAYAIFPDVVVGAAGIGGAHGEGEVYQNGKLVGYADISQVSIGLQLGGQRFAELILFENETSFVNFTHAQVELDARASAVASSEGAAGAANYSRGAIIFTMPLAGLMAQAAIGGQKFRYAPLLTK